MLAYDCIHLSDLFDCFRMILLFYHSRFVVVKISLLFLNCCFLAPCSQERVLCVVVISHLPLSKPLQLLRQSLTMTPHLPMTVLQKPLKPTLKGDRCIEQIPSKPNMQIMIYKYIKMLYIVYAIV